MQKVLKRSLSLLLAFTIIFSSAIVGISEVDFSSLFNIRVFAANESVLEFNVDSDGQLYLQSCDTDASGKVVIPATYNGKPVKYIGDGAFWGCSGVTEIIIPDSVTSIGVRAFIYCSGLELVKFGKGLKNIYDFAFSLTAIEDVVLPEGLETIGNYAFYSSHSIKSVTIPKSLKSIGENAFCGCELLEDVYISDVAAWCNIEFSEYDSNPMCYANNLYLNGSLVKNVVIPEGAKAIPRYAFYSDNITSVTIPSTVKSISDTAFYQCKNITSINVNRNNSVYSSADGVLFNKDKTTLILYPVANARTAYSIPDSVVTIGDNAFCYCEKLVSVTFGKNLKHIGDYAFYECYSISSAILPDTVETIGVFAFFECLMMKELKLSKNLKQIGENAFWLCFRVENALVIPDGVKTIPYGAFRQIGCPEITIPSSVTSIGDCAFGSCNNLKSIVIPNSVTNIGSYAFYECEKLKKVTISNNVQSIGDDAFLDCNNIMGVYCTDKTFDLSAKTIGSGNEDLLNTTWYYGKDPGDITAPVVTTENALNGILVKWNEVNDAMLYDVYRRQGGSSKWVLVGSTIDETSFVDKNVSSGIYYVYSVRAYFHTGGHSAYNASRTSTRKFMATPKLTTIYNHANGLAIKWNAVAGITEGYRVYRRGAGSTYWTYLGTTKNLYFIDSAVKNKSGEYFRYTVIADGGYHSKFDTTGLYLKRLANPTLKSAVSSSAGITVKWGAVSGTTGYYVYRKTTNSNWVRIAAVGGTNNTTYLDKTARKGTTYTYTVRAVYGATTSAYNSGVSCKDKY